MKNIIVNILSGILLCGIVLSIGYSSVKLNNSNYVALADEIDTTTTSTTSEIETTETTTTSISTTKTTTSKTTKKTTSVTTTTKSNITVGTLSISNSNFSTNLVRDDGSYYYLSHSLNGKKDNIGVPFIDYRAGLDNKKTIIYGHSFLNGSGAFNYLQNYENNYDFYNNHKYIYISYGGHNYTYEIFSVYVSLANNKEDEGLEYFRNLSYYSDSEYQEYLDKYKSNSNYNTNVNVTSSDSIIILQTCSNNPLYYEKYYRYNLLVMAKLIDKN